MNIRSSSSKFNKMITEKITSEPMTDGQMKAIKRLLEDGINSFNSNDLVVLGFSKNEAQEILKYGNLVQEDLKVLTIATLQKFAIVDKRFKLLADLGIITVPENYVHGKQLGSLNQGEFYFFNNNITDKNFPKPTRILKPGDKLWVRAFKQVVPGETTSEDRMGFLKKLNAVFTGAQGASLVYQQKRNQLPKGFWYCSFDEKDRLWEDADGDHGVPVVNADSDGAFGFNLGFFERPWDGGNCVLCFCDVPAPEQASA